MFKKKKEKDGWAAHIEAFLVGRQMLEWNNWRWDVARIVHHKSFSI